MDLKPGDKVIVETLCTKSEATVVWQDGSIEENIASRELYPIHALDDQEFFPGDFVVRASINSDLGQVSKISFENKTKKSSSNKIISLSRLTSFSRFTLISNDNEIGENYQCISVLI